MKVVLVPRDIDGSGCYRVLLPGRELRLQRGWDARMAPHRMERTGAVRSVGGTAATRRLTFELDFLLESGADAVWWQPRPEDWVARFMVRLKLRGVRQLMDVDDAWWGLPDWNPGASRDRAQLDAMRAQLRAADSVSVSTPALAELLAPYNRDIRVIRNRVDWRMWEDVTPAYEIERRRVRIGWMGDSTWRRGDLDVLRPWIGDWLRAHPDVEFVAAGDPRVHDLLGIPHEQRVSTNVVEFYNFDLADITAVMDIGLVPLDLSTPEARRLNECKSHLKGLEYAACGIPCVASPSESYRWFLGNPFFLASSPEQWMYALDLMLEDDQWRDLGRTARYGAERMSLQADISEWEAWIAGRGLNAEHARTREPAPRGVAVS